MQDAEADYWPRLLTTWRKRDGLTQAEVAELLEVDQTSVSRWERRIDVPRMSVRRRIRDAFRASTATQRDQVIRLRVRQSLWPQTLVGAGGVFLEASDGACSVAGQPMGGLRGRSIYGAFGPQTDHVTEEWERSGIFNGELALYMAVNALQTPLGKRYIRTLDTPYFSSDDGIWCSCEVKEISKQEYRQLREEFGGPMMMVPFDRIA